MLDVSFHVVAGARVNIGEIHIRGLKRMHESFVRKRLLLHTGEQYGASKVERARKDLLALGVFTSVTVQVGTKADSAGQVPITFRVRERPLHAVSLSGAYSTDLGGSAGVTWTHRDLTGKADQLTLSSSVINLGGTASTGVGYDVSAKYLMPEFGHRDQSLQLAVQAINQSLQAYDQRAVTFGATLNRKLSSIWTASVGVTAEVESIGQEGYFQQTARARPPARRIPVSHASSARQYTCPRDHVSDGSALPGHQRPDMYRGICSEGVFTTNLLTSHYTLLALPFSLLYNTTGLDSPLEDATHGMRASFSEAPTLSLGTKNAKYFVTQVSASFYLDLQTLHLSAGSGPTRHCPARISGPGAGCGPIQPAARPALLRRRQRHHAGLPLSVRRSTIRGRQSDRRHGHQRRSGRIPPADRPESRLRRVPGWRPSEPECESVGFDSALRRRRRRAVLHAHRPDTPGLRHADQS